MIDQHYNFPSIEEVALRKKILDRFTLHYFEASTLPKLHLFSHPNQWANVIYELDLGDQKALLFRLLTSCPNPNWTDKSVTKCASFLAERGRLSRIMVSGVLLRNCAWLHSAIKDPERDNLEYYYSTVAFMCYILTAWEVLENTAPPLQGAVYYYTEKL